MVARLSTTNDSAQVEYVRGISPDLTRYLLGISRDDRLDIEDPRQSDVERRPAGIAARRERRPRGAHLVRHRHCLGCGLADQHRRLTSGEVAEHERHVQSMTCAKPATHPGRG